MRANRCLGARMRDAVSMKRSILLLLAHLPAARAGFTLAPGDDCTVSANGACVESDGYGSGGYEDSQSCSITLQPSAALEVISFAVEDYFCLLYTSPSPRD